MSAAAAAAAAGPQQRDLLRLELDGPLGVLKGDHNAVALGGILDHMADLPAELRILQTNQPDLGSLGGRAHGNVRKETDGGDTPGIGTGRGAVAEEEQGRCVHSKKRVSVSASAVSRRNQD